jgi:hypothetical protein
MLKRLKEWWRSPWRDFDIIGWLFAIALGLYALGAMQNG